METRTAKVIKLGIVVLALFGLPLLGVMLAGKPLAAYVQFPPRTDFVAHAPFSWPAFALTAAIDLLLVGLLVYIGWPKSPLSRPPRQTRSLPWWGWIAGLWVVAAWAMAWSRAEWLAFLQPFKFFLLWLGYIVLVNAVTWQRSGRSPLTHETALLLGLFPASALFWWYFEYLNRFVQNWHYLGAETPSPLTYFLHASLSFSTVLPAIASTLALLRTFPALDNSHFHRRLVIPHPRATAYLALAVAGAGLLGIGVWPDLLFSLLWLAPLLIILALQVLSGEKTWFAPLAQGRWEPLYQPPLAALICGFLWELWNVYSDPKWVYSVPHVQRFELFEMPLLGYAGYLAFGLECAVIIHLLRRRIG